jgi:hypothetical protein
MSLFQTLDDHFCLSVAMQRSRLRGAALPRAAVVAGIQPLTLE